MLGIEQLSVSYGPVKALTDVTIEVPPGQVTAVIGANGAGKSTLMRTLAGLVKPESGHVTLDGVSITGRRPEDIVRAGVALVPEGRSTIPELTIDENIRLGGLWRPKADRDVGHQEVLDLFPVLGQRLRMRADTLSGGERQQLAIGRALMSRPRVLLLDEPSLGLAPKIVKQIFELVASIRATGTSILLVEQNVRGALKVADFGYVMEGGRIVLEGPAAQLRDDPRVRDAYLGGAGH